VIPGGYLQCVTYLIRGSGGAIVVDPGSGSVEEEVLEGIRGAGCSLDEVRYALLTHCHVDHALGAYRFRERGVQLVASRRTAEILRVGGHQAWYEYPDYVIPTEIDLTPSDGEILNLCGIEVTFLETPGHTDGCASYLVETAEGRVVFTGDLIGANGELGWSGSEGFSVEATLASLEKLLATRPAKACRGHGIVAGPAVEWLKRALALGRAGRWEVHGEFHPQATPPPSLKRR
jgi:glyoxylase-like metal-dependent hydrolase (beta-lactamase superfamily II)